MRRERGKAVAILAAVAIVGGSAGMINALAADFMADRGSQLWRLFTMNAFGGLVTIVGGLVGVGAVALRSKVIAGLAGLMFLGATGLTLIALGQTYNLFGGRGSTVSFWLMLGIGFAALAISPEVPSSDRDVPTIGAVINSQIVASRAPVAMRPSTRAATARR